MPFRLSERALRASTYKGRVLDPMEVMFLVLIMFSTLLQLAGNTQPTSIALLLPSAFRTTWLVIMMLGSVAALLGVFWPRRFVDGILLEITGLTAVSFAVVIYGAAQMVAVTINHAALGGLMSGALTILLGLAFGLKALRLQGEIERLKKI